MRTFRFCRYIADGGSGSQYPLGRCPVTSSSSTMKLMANAEARDTTTRDGGRLRRVRARHNPRTNVRWVGRRGGRGPHWWPARNWTTPSAARRRGGYLGPEDRSTDGADVWRIATNYIAHRCRSRGRCALGIRAGRVRVIRCVRAPLRDPCWYDPGAALRKQC